MARAALGSDHTLGRRLKGLAACIALLAVAPAEGRINIDVNGVEGDMKRNVLTFLSLQRYANRDDLDADTVERIAQRAISEGKSALKPFGYYEPKIAWNLREDGKNWRATITVTPGDPVRLKEVDLRIAGPGEQDPLLVTVLKRSTLKVGDQLNHSKYEQVKGDLERAAATYGYFDAKLDRHELLVDPAHKAASVHLALTTGRRYRFGETTIKQKVIDEKLMRKYMRYSQGQPYDGTALLRTQFALDDSQYFSSIEVLPGARDADALTVPVGIDGTANKRNRYSIGAGYGTDTKYRGTIAWDDRLINEHGHRMHVALQGSAILQQLNATYIIPVGDPALEKISFESTYGRTILADVTTTGLVVKPSLTQVLGSWQRVLFLAVNRNISRTALGNNITDNAVVPGISYASIPPGIFSQPVAGRGLYVELTGSHAVLASNSNFLRLFIEDDQRLDIAPKWHLLLRGQLGFDIASHFSELPAFERFFAGGDRSVRGYALNDLSPVDQYGQKIGGRDLVVGSVEIERDLPRSLAVATFVDAGNAMDSFRDHLHYAAGVGLRYRLPAVSIGLDVAKSISENLGPRLHLNIQPVL